MIELIKKREDDYLIKETVQTVVEYMILQDEIIDSVDHVKRRIK